MMKNKRILWLLLIVAVLLPQTLFAASSATYHQLDVNITGSGNGVVRGPGIKCAGDCSQQYKSGRLVTLIAKSGKDSKFAGWDGCNKSIREMCLIKMNDAKVIAATFNRIAFEQPLLAVSLNALTAPVIMGSANAILADIKLSNGSAENVRLSSITFTYTGPLYAIQNIKLYDGNGGMQIGQTISAVGENITFHDLNVIISGDSSINLMLKADISMMATSGSLITLGINNASDVTATGVASGYAASLIGTPISVTTIISSSILQIFIASGSPSMISGRQDVEMIRLDFFAESWGEYVLIDSIAISFNGIVPGVITNVRLMTPWYSQIGDTAPSLDNNGRAVFQNLNWIIPPGSIQELRVYADFFPNTRGTMAVGINQPSDISAIGLTTATTTLIGVNSPLMTNVIY